MERGLRKGITSIFKKLTESKLDKNEERKRKAKMYLIRSASILDQVAYDNSGISN